MFVTWSSKLLVRHFLSDGDKRAGHSSRYFLAIYPCQKILIITWDG